MPVLKTATAIVGASLLAIAAHAGIAAAADAIHVRGTISSVDGNKVTIHTREGKDVSLTLGDAWKIGGVEKASMADVKPGAFIGTANMVGPTGAKALEVVVFPEALRGTGEGDYGWDLKQGSSMTNANVNSAVEGVDGRTVTLSYKGGQKKVTIPPDAPVVQIVPATVADVKPGTAVFAAGTPEGDTMLSGGRLVVGKDGAQPPM